MNIFQLIINKIFGKFNPEALLKNMNFDFGWGTQLARLQDSIIADYLAGKPLPAETVRDLHSNIWVMSAKRVAPGNLVIRQLCLIDILNNNTNNKIDILDQLNKVSYKGIPDTYRIWAEGYSYWMYTRAALDLWQIKFNDAEVGSIIAKVNSGFVQTAYLRGTTWYPAPFGDLRDEPLAAVLQVNHSINNIIISILKLEKNDNVIRYTIAARPLGVNTHVPKNNTSVIVNAQGVPLGFTFYQGYDKKYINKAAEMLDTYDPKRLATII